MWENGILLVMVMGLSELLKRTGMVNSKFLPFWNIFIAMALNLFYRGFSYGGLLLSLIIGVGATGIYSSCKNVLEWRNQCRKEKRPDLL